MRRVEAKLFTCRRCNKDFSSHGMKAYYCNECRRLKWKLWKKKRTWETSEEGKSYMHQYAIKYREAYKAKVYDFYGWSCSCCGEKLISMLTVDHVHNDGFKDRQLKISGASMYKKIVKENFPNDYQILCMNCNWSKKINKGICEHKK